MKKIEKIEHKVISGHNQTRDIRDPLKLASTLAQDLDGEVHFNDGTRALYATDASNYREVPIGVVVPRHREDVIKAVKICSQYGVPILGRGAGTSLAGQACNAAVILDMSKYMNRVLEIDAESRTARVEPGVVLDRLCGETEPVGLTFGPDPSTHSRCTLGGMIGNNACGVHSILSGKTVENVESLEIVTYDGTVMEVGPMTEEAVRSVIEEGGRKGEIYAALLALRQRFEEQIRSGFPELPRRVSGYNLDQLLSENQFNVARALVGTEGTCAIVLSARVKLIKNPASKVLAVLGFEDIYQAADRVPMILKHTPAGLEGLDDILASHQKDALNGPRGKGFLPEGRGWLLVEFADVSADKARTAADAMIEDLKSQGVSFRANVLSDPAEQRAIWEFRESALGATVFVPGKKDTWPGWEDSAVRPEDMGAYTRELRALMNKYEYEGTFYGHFGDGCLHARISFDLISAPGIKKFRRFMFEAADLVVRYKGSLSGEHGDGQARGELLTRMYGKELVEAFTRFKEIWDPLNKMNPGKVVHARAMTDSLRLEGWTDSPVETFFRYPDEGGSFRKAMLRCIGIGKCRREKGGTMCPSYKVTRDEKHSTRGRARLLYEMADGKVIKDGWKSEAVKDALDLCLSCKACKSECPVGVDMSTYKAEFMAQYYKGKRRPLSAYFFGWIYVWARWASKMPKFFNALSRLPVFASTLKKVGNIAAERTLPVFADKSFRKLFEERVHAKTEGQEVLIWTDTFNGYFYPKVLLSAVDLLETLGFQVRIARKKLCCGRPLYDHGMLSQAKAALEKIMKELRGELERKVPVLVLEPGCLSVFRDELMSLFPEREDAKALNELTFSLAEFLNKYVPDLPPFGDGKELLFHQHCHHTSVIGTDADRALWERLKLNYRVADAGCCGMAGSFGYQEENYQVSTAVGEQKLMPAVRELKKESILVSDGFSCREQIRHLTGREAVHFSELLAPHIKNSQRGGT